MARVITGRPTSAAAAAARPLRLATQLQQTLITSLLLQAAEVPGCCSAQPGFSIGRKSQRNSINTPQIKKNFPTLFPARQGSTRACSLLQYQP